MVLDHTIIPVVGARLDEPPGVGGEESVIVVEVEQLRIPLGVIRHQPGGDVLSRLIRAPRILNQIEAADSYRLPHIGGPTRSLEQLTSKEVKP